MSEKVTLNGPTLKNYLCKKHEKGFKSNFFLSDYDYDYDCYSVKKTDYDYDYSEKNGNRLPNRLPIEGDYTSLITIKN